MQNAIYELLNTGKEKCLSKMRNRVYHSQHVLEIYCCYITQYTLIRVFCYVRDVQDLVRFTSLSDSYQRDRCKEPRHTLILIRSYIHSSCFSLYLIKLLSVQATSVRTKLIISPGYRCDKSVATLKAEIQDFHAGSDKVSSEYSPSGGKVQIHYLCSGNLKRVPTISLK